MMLLFLLPADSGVTMLNCPSVSPELNAIENLDYRKEKDVTQQNKQFNTYNSYNTLYII